MARLPAIASRPTPRRKHVSTAVPNSSSSSTAPDQMAHVHVKKAAKRAAKRENVLFSSRNSNTMTRSLATDDSGAQVSKSALRRRKRKIRDQAVLGQSGLRYLKEQLNVFDDSDSQQVSSVEGHPLPGLSHDANKILDDVVGPALTLYANEVNRGSRGSTKVGERLRKKVLAQEQLRQPHILKDLHRQAATSHPASQSSRAPSPALAGFAAIRQHAKNTLGLTAPVAPQTSGKKEQDVTMT